MPLTSHQSSVIAARQLTHLENNWIHPHRKPIWGANGWTGRKLTKDLVPVIFHDDDLDRTKWTGPMPKWNMMIYATLRKLVFRGLWEQKFRHWKKPSKLFCNEIGNQSGNQSPCAGREVETSEAMLDVLSQIWDDRDRLLITSFSHVLETSMDMAEDWYRGLCWNQNQWKTGKICRLSERHHH